MAFATIEDLGTLTGRALTEAETSRGTLLLDLAAGAILTAVDKDQAWADTLTPVPPGLRLLCLTVAARVMNNPGGLRSQSEALGAYQHAESFSDTTINVELSTAERLDARRIVYGSTSGSVRLGSIIDDPTVAGHFDATNVGLTSDPDEDDEP